MKYDYLLEKAYEAQKRALPSYSKFYVGAALETKEGEIILGCNIEVPSYSLTICAERTAIFKALSDGKREFIAMAIVGDSDDYCMPCGSCRQVIFDLCGDIDIIVANKKRESKILKMSELLPFAFSDKDLK